MSVNPMRRAMEIQQAEDERRRQVANMRSLYDKCERQPEPEPAPADETPVYSDYCKQFIERFGFAPTVTLPAARPGTQYRITKAERPPVELDFADLLSREFAATLGSYVADAIEKTNAKPKRSLMLTQKDLWERGFLIKTWFATDGGGPWLHFTISKCGIDIDSHYRFGMDEDGTGRYDDERFADGLAWAETLWQKEYERRLREKAAVDGGQPERTAAES